MPLRFHCVVVDGLIEADARSGVTFHPADGLDAWAIGEVQANVRRRLLRSALRRGQLAADDAQVVAEWEHGGGFSVDAQVATGTDNGGAGAGFSAAVQEIRHEVHDLHGRERAKYLKCAIGIPILPWTIFRPSFVLRSPARLFLLWLTARKVADMPSFCGSHPRVSSPPAAGSTLMTSAPSSPRDWPHSGPASTLERSMTRRP